MRNPLPAVFALILSLPVACLAVSGETSGVKIQLPDNFVANPARHPSSTFTTLDFVDHSKRLGVSLTVDDRRADPGAAADIHEALKSPAETSDAAAKYSRGFVSHLPGSIVGGPDSVTVAGRSAVRLVFRDPADPNKALDTFYTFILEGRVVTVMLLRAADAPDADVRLLESTLASVQVR